MRYRAKARVRGRGSELRQVKTDEGEGRDGKVEQGRAEMGRQRYQYDYSILV